MNMTMPRDVREALADRVTEYCYRVDTIGAVEPLLDLFTDDAIADFSAIGLPLMNGKGDIRAFFTGVFDMMTHHFHLASNIRPESWDGTTGVVTAYVIGMGRAKDGNSVTVQVRYRMAFVQAGGEWRCNHYHITPMMPLPGSLEQIHAD